MRKTVLGALLSVAHLAAWAAQDDDTRRIPQSILQDDVEQATAPAWTGSAFIEANAEAVTRRALAVPIDAGSRSRQVRRLLADIRGDRQIGEAFSAKLSARLGAVRVRDGGSSRIERLDLREAAVQWHAGDQGVFELGRVNLRQGVATGFNPTDFFKSRSAVDLSTRDPEELRVNRLGTVVLSGQYVGADESLMVALAPHLAPPASLVRSEPPPGLRLGDTNHADRVLVKGQLGPAIPFRPELLAFRDDAGWRAGVNLTQAVGRQTTLFLEYAGGRRQSILRQALEDGVALHDLPAAARTSLAVPDGKRWQDQLAAGWTWTSSGNISFTTEFDYNRAGFGADDWQRWRAVGTSGSTGARLAWYLRGYAATEQEPLFRRNLFLRMQWDRAGSRDLYVTAFLNRNLDDGSSMGQVSLEYRLSQAARVRAMLLLTGGSATSQNGSDPARRTVLLSYTRYL
jgi:hypothetical protein